MIKNYLKTAIRSLQNNLFYSFINISGLALGIACCLLIVLYVQNELSYDQHFSKLDRLHRVYHKGRIGGNDLDMALTGSPLGETFMKDFPEVEQFCRVRTTGPVLGYEDPATGTRHTFKEDDVAYADPAFLQMFDIELLQGNATEALAAPNSVIISEESARKYFGEQSPLGKSFTVDGDETWQITGVCREIPANTHFQLDMLASITTIDDLNEGAWMNMNYYTYLLLKPGADAATLEAKFPEIVARYVGPEIERFVGVSLEEFQKAGNAVGYFLQPVEDIHLHSHLRFEVGNNGNITYIWIFSAIAGFILLIACINFMNLSTARSANRAKEVGIRKVMGSLRSHLVFQFLCESVLLSAVAFVIACLLVFMLLPWFNELSGKQLEYYHFFEGGMLLWLLLGILLTGLLAGSYPAFFLSAFQPVTVLKGRLKSGAKSGRFRSVLVVFQFITTIVLITSTLVVMQQLNYLQKKQLGYNKEQVLILWDTYVMGSERINSFKNEILRDPDVESVTVTGFLPVESYRNFSAVFPDGNPDNEKTTTAAIFTVDMDYLKTMNIEVLSGRDFSTDFPSDSGAVLVNEQMVKQFGWGEDVLGQRVGTFTNNNGDVATYEIVGVVKDFHFSSLHEEIGPLMMRLGSNTGAIAIRMNTAEVDRLLAEVQQKWKAFVPGQPINYTFMDENFSNQYRNEQRVGKLFGTFAVLAIFIACLGLFGLAAFTAEQRTKEIGVRKVLGASVPGIVMLLSREFSKLVLLAFAVAAPAGWFIMERWLSDFAYRVDLNPGIFVLAGLAAFVVAWLTMSFQSIKAALSNPVKSLKAE